MAEKIKRDYLKYVLFLALALFIIPVVSAGFFDFFGDLITGLQTQTFTVTVSVQNYRPNITLVTNGTLTLTAGTTALFNISFIAQDTNGAGDLNNNSIIMNATYSSPGSSTEFVRNFTCIVAPGQTGLTANQRNYSCVANNFTFFDGSGSWNISVSIADNASNYTENLTQSFTIAQLISINLTLTDLQFPAVSAGNNNVTSSNDPQRIQNIGNKNNIAINLTGIDLLGDSDGDPANRIQVVNFSINYVTGTGNRECNYNGTAGAGAGARLLNNTGVPINVTILKGADRLNDTYYCLLHVPGNILAQTHSSGGTPNEADWTVTSG